MTFRNSTTLMNVFLYGMINESDLFSFFFFQKTVQKEFGIKFAVNMVT